MQTKAARASNDAKKVAVKAALEAKAVTEQIAPTPNPDPDPNPNPNPNPIEPGD